MFCTECGRLLNDQNKFCPDCGARQTHVPATAAAPAPARVAPPPPPAVLPAPVQTIARVEPPIPPPHASSTPTPPRDYSKYQTYYQRAFRHFDENPHDIVRWNWGVFFFGLLWYLYRGMVAKAVVYFIAIVMLGALTAGVGAFLAWFVLASIGTHDYYLKEVKGKPLW